MNQKGNKKKEKKKGLIYSRLINNVPIFIFSIIDFILNYIPIYSTSLISGGGGGGGGGTGELSPWPSYIQDRITLFDKLYTEYQEYLSTRERKPIQVSSF